MHRGVTARPFLENFGSKDKLSSNLNHTLSFLNILRELNVFSVQQLFYGNSFLFLDSAFEFN